MEILRFASLTHLHPLSHEQLAQIAPHASERTIPAGRRILLDGPFAQEFAIIASGRGIVRCAGEMVAELGPGHVFGELAPERPVYETATVTAITDLRLVVFGARALKMLRSVAPETVAAPTPTRLAPQPPRLSKSPTAGTCWPTCATPRMALAICRTRRSTRKCLANPSGSSRAATETGESGVRVRQNGP